MTRRKRPVQYSGASGARRHRSRPPSRLQPWRGVAVVAVIGAAVVWGRESVGYLGARLSDASGCSVTSVVDGDTVRVYCPGQGRDTARLTGFDAPEVFSPGCASEAWAGTQATWALQRHVWSADEVVLAFRGRDKYDRRLAVLRVDGSDVARLMIDAGHARPYRGGRRRSWCD